MTENHKPLTTQLEDAARAHAAAATLAPTIEAELARYRAASQLRLVGGLLRGAPHLENVGRAWLTASETMLTAYADHDAAHDETQAAMDQLLAQAPARDRVILGALRADRRTA